MNRRFLLLAGALSALSLPRAAAPCGISTHVEVSHRASWWFACDDSPEFEQWVAAYPEALQGGASFPDWGYALPNYGDAGEEAHWDPFLQAATDYIYRTYPPPWDTETKRTAVFLLAVAAHSVADISWHGLGVSEGMIDVVSAQDTAGDWDHAHSISDTGGDMVTAYELDQSYMTAPWYVPTRDMVAVYHELGYDTVTADKVILANFLLFLGGHAEKLAGQLLYPYTANQSPVLIEHMLDYFVGGMDDMSVFSAWKWLDMIDWMENGAPGARRTVDQRLDHGNEHAFWIDVGLDLLESGRARVILEKTARGILFRFDVPDRRAALAVASDSIVRTLGIAPHGGSLDDDEASIRSEARGELALAAVRPRPARRIDAGIGNDRPHRSVRRPLRRSHHKAAAGGLELTLGVPYAHLGTSLASGDFNHDGRSDLVVGAPGLGGPGEPERGAVFLVYSGKTLAGQQVDLETGADAVLYGADDYGRFGWALAVVDLNADGIDDLAVSAPTTGARWMDYHGRVYVYFGRTGGGLAATPDVTIETAATYSNLGYTLSSGDADLDGHADLLIGAPFAREGGTQRGLAAVFLASSARASGILDIGDADWLASGERDWDWFGMSVGTAEVPGRGVFLLVGAPSFDDAGQQSVGRLYGFDLAGIGAAEAPQPAFTVTGAAAFDQTGFAFAVGDPFGLGAPVLAFSSPTHSEDATDAGAISLVPIDALDGDLSTDALSTLVTLLGGDDFVRLGWQLRFGDVDRDGLDDLWASSPWRRGSAGVEAGVVYLWRGSELPSGTVSRAERIASWQVEGGAVAGRAGCALTFTDLDGDDASELVVSSRLASTIAPLAGTVSVVPTSTLSNARASGYAARE